MWRSERFDRADQLDLRVDDRQLAVMRTDHAFGLQARADAHAGDVTATQEDERDGPRVIDDRALKTRCAAPWLHPQGPHPPRDRRSLAHGQAGDAGPVRR